MSLDILRCCIVPPEHATQVYTGDVNCQHSGATYVPALSVLQEKGLICVQAWHRIGRNCLDDAWHRRDGELQTDPVHDPEDMLMDFDAMLFEHSKSLVVLPGEVEEKIGRYLMEGVTSENNEEGRFWRPEVLEDGDWDFLYISR